MGTAKERLNSLLNQRRRVARGKVKTTKAAMEKLSSLLNQRRPVAMGKVTAKRTAKERLKQMPRSLPQTSQLQIPNQGRLLARQKTKAKAKREGNRKQKRKVTGKERLK